jgi:hypothetical protein
VELAAARRRRHRDGRAAGGPARARDEIAPEATEAERDRLTARLLGTLGVELASARTCSAASGTPSGRSRWPAAPATPSCWAAR